MMIVIPVKPFAQAKSRLSTVLSPPERKRLSRFLFNRTLYLARQVGPVVVVSREASARKLAKAAGAWALVEAGTNLNESLRQASDWVSHREAEAILILPGDLPRLTVTDLVRLAEAGRPDPAVVIAPCHRQEGTNALLLRPPGLIEFSFGPESFKRHHQAARAIGLEPVIYRSPTVAFDLDWPADLARLAKGDKLPALRNESPDIGLGDG